MKAEDRRAPETLEYISKIMDQENIAVNRYMIMVEDFRSCPARLDAISWM